MDSERARDAARKSSGEARELAEATAKTKQSLTVGLFATTFGKAELRHRIASWIWLVLALLGLDMMVSQAIRFGSEVGKTELDGPQLTYYLGARLLLLATGYMVLFWIGRNYKAARHLASVNEHRRLALETFETFRDMVDASPEVRAEVTKEMVKAVFAPAVTGYLGGDENIPGPIAEIFKNARS